MLSLSAVIQPESFAYCCLTCMVFVLFVLCCLFAAHLEMSDYNSDPLEDFNPSGELLLKAAQSRLAQSPVQR